MARVPVPSADGLAAIAAAELLRVQERAASCWYCASLLDGEPAGLDPAQVAAWHQAVGLEPHPVRAGQ